MLKAVHNDALAPPGSQMRKITSPVDRIARKTGRLLADQKEAAWDLDERGGSPEWLAIDCRL
jgi:hypothetical protein